MDKELLSSIAKRLVAKEKGILAADESIGTMTKRLDAIGVESTVESRRAFRDVLLTTSGLNNFISGVILFDETIRQSSDGGDPFPYVLENSGVLTGIKVDNKAIPMTNFPGERITAGIDGLDQRLKDYKALGASFAKWRAVITIAEDIPTDTCINSNAELLARYAAICQDNGIVPIVEPEVMMDGNHDMKRCEQVTYSTIKKVFTKLVEHKVYLGGVLLKINMVVPGNDSDQEVTDEEVANATMRVFKDNVPDEVPGIVFLSGGQNDDVVTSRLNAIALLAKESPWEVSYSFGRALQEDALMAWKGKRENIDTAKAVFLDRAEKDSLARRGILKEV